MSWRWCKGRLETRAEVLSVGCLCAVISIMLLIICIKRWRAPAFGIECQYISAALTAHHQWRSGQGIIAALFDWQWSVGNASVLSSLVAFPFLMLIPGRQSMLWLSTLVCSSLAVLVLTHLIVRERIVRTRRGTALAALAAAFMIWGMPVFLLQSVTFTAAAPAVFAAALALWAYRWAWRRDTRWAWGLASLMLLVSWWAKPEWGGLFVCLMMLTHCVDTWWHAGWRAGVTSIGVLAGSTPWAVFALYPWGADRSSFILLGFLFLAAGAWLILLERGGAAAQRTSAYMLPALAGVSAWLATGDNGRMWLRVVREELLASSASQSVLGMLRSEWYATPLALLIVLSLAVIGVADWWRRWGGFVFFGTVLAFTAILVPVQTEVQITLFACVVACWAGVGFVEVFEKAPCSNGRLLSARARVAILLGLLVLILAWRLPQAAADAFVPAYRTTVPTFDRTRMGWEVISHVRAILPTDTTCAYTPDTPTFSRLTLDTYSQLYRWGWEVQPWPHDLAAATATWLIILTPNETTSTLRYVPDSRAVTHCHVQRAALDSNPHYHKVMDVPIAGGRFRLSVYRRTTNAPGQKTLTEVGTLHGNT